MIDQYVQVIKVLEPEEVEKILTYFDEDVEFKRSEVYFEKNQSKKDSSRTSYTGGFKADDVDISKLLDNRVYEAVKEYLNRLTNATQPQLGPHYHLAGNFLNHQRPLSLREGYSLLKYRKGDQYHPHTDVGDEPGQILTYRQVSMVLYLNGDFEGGSTAFFHTAVKPSPGYAVFFPSNNCFVHSGTPVQRGTKKVIATWFHHPLTKECLNNTNPKCDEFVDLFESSTSEE